MPEETTKPAGYNVVFESAPVKAVGGVRTWSRFKDKAEFDTFMKNPPGSVQVIGEGLTSNACMKLTRSTPPLAYLANALDSATEPKTGRVNMVMLGHELQKAIFAIENTQKCS